MSQKLALIIGNSEYEDGTLARLLTPDVDVNALVEVLRDPQIGAFDEVQALVNQPTTTIRRAIASFFAGRGRDDLMLLYFSGHGVRDDRGQLFLAVKDTEHNLLRGTAIPAAYITEEMDNSRSRRQVLILDCCHSGAFSQGMKAASGASVGTAAAFEGVGSGRVVLTATDATQYAWEGDRVIGQAENSVFTHHLIQGLRTGQADTDGDGQITLDELYNYVYEQVVFETPKQTPGKWSYGQRGEIVIARNPRPVVKPVELPPDLQQTIDDPRPWVREGAVKELDRMLKGSHPGLALAAYETLKRMANDDSRRVAAVATESLEAYDQAQSASKAAEAGQKSTASQKQQEVPARPADKPVEAQKKIPESVAPALMAQAVAGQESLEQQKAGVGRQTTEQAGAKAGTEVETAGYAGAPAVWKWSPILLITGAFAITWGLGWVASVNYGWSGTSFRSVWAVIWAILGIVIGLALQQVERSIGWKQILVITIGSVIGMFIGASVGTTLSSPVMDGSIHGVILGLTIGLVLWWTKRSIQWQQILVITLGWTIALFFGQVIGRNLNDLINNSISTSTHLWAAAGAFTGAIPMSLSDVIGRNLYDLINNTISIPIGLWAIPGAFTGATVGAIGSIVMFWQLIQVRDQAGPERLALPNAEVGEYPAEKNGVQAGQATKLSAVITALQRSPILLITIGLAIGWAIGWLVSENLGWSSTSAGNIWAIMWAILGVISGLALQQVDRSITWKQILVIAIGWFITSIVYGYLVNDLGFSTVIGGASRGIIIGLTFGLILWWTDRSVQWQQILIITIGWAIGMLLSEVAGKSLYETWSNNFSGSSALLAIFGAISGAIGGVVGSAVMIWQLDQVRRSALSLQKQ